MSGCGIQSYSKALRSESEPRPERPIATATRTLTLQPKGCSKSGKIYYLINKLDELNISQYIEGARSTGTAFIEITAVSTDSFKEVNKKLEGYPESQCKVLPVADEVPYSLLIDGLHAEYAMLAITEHLHKYFIDPKIKILMHRGTRILNGKAKVSHKGQKMLIKKLIFIWPNMSAKVVGQTHLPLEQFKVRCTKCLEGVHMVYSCRNEVRCSKCRERGHHRRDCEAEKATDRYLRRKGRRGNGESPASYTCKRKQHRA